MWWSTKNQTTYSYPNVATSANVTISVAGGGGGGSTGITAMPVSSILPAASGGGSSNQVYTSSGWTTVTSPSIVSQSGIVTMTGNLHIDSHNPHINTRKNKINIDKLIQNLEIVNDMFHIIVPDLDKLERNPTLMDAFRQYDSAKHIEPRYNSEQYIAAYEQYKLLEVLTEEQHDNS